MDKGSCFDRKVFYRFLYPAWVKVGLAVAFTLALVLVSQAGMRLVSAQQAGPYEVNVVITSITPNPAYIHQVVTLAVSVTAKDPTAGVPSGTVEVRSGQAVQCRIILDGLGAGSCSLTYITPGPVALRAVYAGKSPFLPGVSKEATLQINDQIHPGVAISSQDPNPSYQADPFSVMVQVTSGSPVPTGTVRVFRSDVSCTVPGPTAAADRCDASLSGGSGSCNLTPSVIGNFYLCASYPGDAAHTAVTSSSVLHQASDGNTFTKITRVDPSPSILGKTATVYFTVASFFPDTPTGTVTVSSGPDTCSGTVASGQCTLTFTRPHIQQVTAAYAGGQSGESIFDPNTSLPFAQRVNAPPTDILLSESTVKRYSPTATEVGILTAKDPNSDESHTFTLVAGDGAQHNAYFRIDGNRLLTGVPLSESGSLSIRVRATDPFGLSYEEILSLTLTGGDTQLPNTGFASGIVTRLPQQPSEKDYFQTGSLVLEIPALDVRVEIVGVPVREDGWDTTWLGNQAGWLEGTAFPTWPGNAVLAAHNYLSDATPGPFARLSDLSWGDTIQVQAYGSTYTYAVRTVEAVRPSDTSALQHEDKSWLTLVTCGSYDEKAHTYRRRVIVRAVLMGVR